MIEELPSPVQVLVQWLEIRFDILSTVGIDCSFHPIECLADRRRSVGEG